MTPECRQLGLQAERIVSDRDALILGSMRNRTRHGFAHDTSEITAERQREWWQQNKRRVKAWLYWCHTPKNSLAYVGFGVLRQTDDSRWWSSVGVLPEFGGNGFGGAITADLIRRAGEQVWAEARLDNPQAMRLHRDADWEEYDRDERVAHYRTRPHVWMAEPLATWAVEGWALT